MVTVVDMNDKMIIDDIPVGVEPEGMGLTNNGKILVNTSETTNMAHFINAETLDITENVLVDARPRVAMFTPDDKEVWVSAEIGGTVKVIDPNSKKLLTLLDLRSQVLMKKVFNPLVLDIQMMENILL